MICTPEIENVKLRKPIVINWHVTEACNYHCRYCYAKWERPDRRDLIRDLGATSALLESLFACFGTPALASKPRLNFAGGEPLLYADRVVSAMRRARSIGFDVSIISNGSRLDARLTADLAPELSLLGLSIDAAAPEVLAIIGRQDRRRKQLDLAMLAEHVAIARLINPSLLLKVNTVVCSANWRQDMSAVITDFAPDRWKLLRMLPVASQELEASGEQFRAFIERHRDFSDVITFEDNEDMAGSYIMVDPYGRFFQNRTNAAGYDYSPRILDVGAAEAFSRMSWSPQKFDRRYSRGIEIRTSSSILEKLPLV